MAHGAVCGFSCLPGPKNEHRVRRTLETGGLVEPRLYPCNLSKDEDLDAMFEAVARDFGTITFVIHSVAYADRAYLRIGKFTETPRNVFAEALDISAYSLLAVAHRARQLMPQGGSIVALSYYGAEKVIPGYNVMGVAKAALEAAARYLAAELGPHRVRVNTLSAGPCRTLSAMAVDGVDEMFEWVERKAPLQRNIDTDEVGRSAVYLVSELSSGVTGENLYVDAGYNTMGL